MIVSPGTLEITREQCLVKNILLFSFLSCPRAVNMTPQGAIAASRRHLYTDMVAQLHNLQSPFLNTLPWPFIVRACRGSTYLHSLMATTTCIRP